MLTLQHIEKYIVLTDGFYLWKDSESEYLGISQKFARLLGYRNAKQIMGLRDEHLSWAQFAEAAVANDQTALSQGSHQAIEYACFGKSAENIPFLVSKNPFADEQGEILGVFAHAVPLAQLRPPSLAQRNLSAREKQSLHWFLHGKSCREIGEILNLSIRTIEKHLESLKLKFNAESKAALIIKAIREGYLDFPVN